MSWPTRPLAEIADFQLGKMLDQRKNKGELRPYLANVDVRWGRIEIADLREMRFEERERDRFSLQPGDIVMCEGGEPGRCAIWEGKVPSMMYQKALHRIRVGPEVDHRYLFYIFLHMGMKGLFEPYFTGSTIKHMPRAELARVEVPVPPLPTQRRIAAILSAYDDLIEVNTRRIAILEEMARRVYEEWFGSGCASPEQIPLRDLCSGEGLIQTGPFGSQLHQREYVEAGVPVVMPKDISGGRIDTVSCAKVSRATADRLARHKAEPGDLLFARRGEVGRFALVRDYDGEVLCGTGCLLVRPDRSMVSPHFLARYFERSEVAASLEARAIGATMANLNTGILSDTLVRIGPPEMMNRYHEKASLLDATAGALAQMNANLRTQRDLLLPRLVSGKIDVCEAAVVLDESAA